MTGSLTAFFSVLASYNYCFSLLVRVRIRFPRNTVHSLSRRIYYDKIACSIWTSTEPHHTGNMI